MIRLLCIAAGGALGALARYGLAGAVHERTGTIFPWGTLTVNLNKLLPFLDETVTEGLVTLEKVRVIKYRHSGGQAGSSATSV